MYSGESGSSYSHSNTKSCIQALLKNREQNPVSNRSSINWDRNYSDKLSAPANHSDLGGSSQNFDFSPSPSDHNSNEVIPPENLDNDFNYSQKLFHIADGNLYSIFSPIQGRSYGMKPSFLRKQKYTVQECHGRGRRNLRKGLKFHNFLPSESVTSEKDNGYLRSKWKVHSECRLREEHGTKQITISNWSQSVQDSANEPMNIIKPIAKSDPAPTRTQNISSLLQTGKSKYAAGSAGGDNGSVDPYDFSLSLHGSNVPETATSLVRNSSERTTTSTTIGQTKTSTRSAASKKDSLSFLLNSLLDRPDASEKQSVPCDAAESLLACTSQSQKHRRKPVQTRRVVPYTKYLSIMEEGDSVPLDLSSKFAPENLPNIPSADESRSVLVENHTAWNSPLSNSVATKFQTNAALVSSGKQHFSMSNDNILPNTSALQSLLQNQIPTPLMFLSQPVYNGLNVGATSSEAAQVINGVNGNLNLTINTKQVKIRNSFPPGNMNLTPLNNPQFAVHKTFAKERPSRTRRRNQRSVIKQKLEDTFRQNGFLVKTKQVSDGEATFCKFRQLRKYTRYYLKSWQQHLPDEVNKMWKGFLPPKTVLPSVSGIVEASNNVP